MDNTTVGAAKSAPKMFRYEVTGFNFFQKNTKHVHQSEDDGEDDGEDEAELVGAGVTWSPARPITSQNQLRAQFPLQ